MSDNKAQRPTRAAVDLDALAFNFRSARNFMGAELNYMAVVKADAYGHGAVECAIRLEGEGVDWFGVATAEEGIELRKAGVLKPILCLGGFWDGQEELALDYHLTPVVFQIERADILNGIAERRGTDISVHVKIDTGMGRVGVRCDAVQDFAKRLRSLSRLRVEGLMTHFAAADDLSENEFTELQIKRFEKAVEAFNAEGHEPLYLDLANSPGAVAHPGSRGNLVRLGGVLYGLGDDALPGGIDKPELRPVMSLHTRIAYLKTVPPGETIGYGRTFKTDRPSLIATIPIGYQDGYRRALSNIGRAIVRGRLAPVAGRISMDWTTLDVTGVPGVAVGDEVVLIGRHGSLGVSAADLAKLVGTISYEITCGIGRRVRREYLQAK